MLNRAQNRLGFAVACFAVVTAIFLYFFLYVRFVLGRGGEDYLESFPRMIQTATLMSFLCYVGCV